MRETIQDNHNDTREVGRTELFARKGGMTRAISVVPERFKISFGPLPVGLGAGVLLPVWPAAH